MERTMRAAICFSGQPRTFEKCYPSWQYFIERLKEDLDLDTDIFCHIWNFNTPPHVIVGVVDDWKTVKSNLVEQSELDKLLNLLKPKRYLIEDETVSKMASVVNKERAKLYDNKPLLDWASSQFYGIMMANEQRKRYEIDNNVHYDVVFKLRYDLFLEETEVNNFSDSQLCIPKPNTIYSCHTGHEPSCWPFYRLGDIFWMADSLTYDKLSQFYRFLPIIGKNSLPDHVGTEHSLYYYAKMMRLNVRSLYIGPKVYRMPDYVDKKIEYNIPGGLGGHELM
jgi:hypothetical protein